MSTTQSNAPVVMSSGHTFLECVRWHDGAVYASDFFSHRVLRWDGDGAPSTVCEIPAQPSGIGWMPDGTMLVVSMIDRRLMRIDPDGQPVEVADLSKEAPWHLNDMVVDSEGRAYIGNFGWDESTDPVIKPAPLQRVDPDGSVHVVAEELICPNGMAISPDGRTLFVNETFAARVTAFEIADDGSLANRRIWASFSEETFETVPQCLASGVILPDGMALDSEGAIWLADCHGTGAHRVVAGGQVVDHVSTAPHATFAVALGGEDRRTMYMCTTFAYGDGDPRSQHESAMRRCPVEVAGAGLP